MINPTPANGPYYWLSDPESCWETKRTHLFYQQLPIDAHSGLFVLHAIFSQTSRKFTHPFQTVTTIQQILDVLGHDFRNILELIIYPVETLRCAAVLVELLGALDKGVKFDKGVWSQIWRLVLCWRVGCGEFRGNVGEIGEGKFAGVGMIAYAKETNVVFE